MLTPTAFGKIRLSYNIIISGGPCRSVLELDNPAGTHPSSGYGCDFAFFCLLGGYDLGPACLCPCIRSLDPDVHSFLSDRHASANHLSSEVDLGHLTDGRYACRHHSSVCTSPHSIPGVVMSDAAAGGLGDSDVALGRLAKRVFVTGRRELRNPVERGCCTLVLRVLKLVEHSMHQRGLGYRFQPIRRLGRHQLFHRLELAVALLSSLEQSADRVHESLGTVESLRVVREVELS